MHKSECSIKVIEKAMYLCEFASPCIGRKIPIEESSPYKMPILGSNVPSAISRECGHYSR
jgi:hypothetical protein